MELEDMVELSILGVMAGVSMWVGIWEIVRSRIYEYDQKIAMDEIMKQVIDGKDSGVTFNDFPYFLRYVMY
jgi:hypothetical protein